MVPKINTEQKIAAASTMVVQTADSIPTAKPERMVVAEPVVVAFFTSCTGFLSVPVKYSVRRSMLIASRIPMVVTAKERHQPPGTWSI